MSRLPAPALDPETAALLEPYRLPDSRPLPIFQALAHSRTALDDLRRATAACLKAPSLTPRLREIAILRICARAGAAAEWAVHVEMFAAQARLTDTELEALANAPHGAGTWDEQESVVVRPPVPVPRRSAPWPGAAARPERHRRRSP